EHGVAVGRRTGDEFGRQIAAGARPALDNELLAENLRHLQGDEAGDHVGAAAGSEWNDDADRTVGPARRRRLRQRATADDRRREHRGGGKPNEPTAIDHVSPASLTFIALSSSPSYPRTLARTHQRGCAAASWRAAAAAARDESKSPKQVAPEPDMRARRQPGYFLKAA